MVTITFANPTPGTNEDAAVSVVWYDSTDGAAFTEIATSLISALPYDLVSGLYTWACSQADPTHYQLIKTVSAGGVQSFAGSLLPPLPANPTLQSLFGYAKDLGTAWSEGDTVTVTPRRNQIVNGVIVNPKPKTTQVLNGIFSILVDKTAEIQLNVGDYYVKTIIVSLADTANIKDYK